ncbi:hypothetical protein CEXT_209141 [Caerostris extrusa]|uniref:Uncharacterized protein n=1 Tax=Caerostris extrusa TaxID=172846 RepID=A0AAV4MJG1_CAEEX|nr:hypothetical protein CEXT_209141 [Caerostris extrusa]
MGNNNYNFLKQTTQKEISDIHRCYSNSKSITSISSKKQLGRETKGADLRSLSKPLHSKKGKPSKQRGYTKEFPQKNFYPVKSDCWHPVPSSLAAHALPLLKD